jgi:3-phosphoshikimate 1-carboxyvinyltransferase
MALPDLIEIVPLDQPVRAEITVPGSKSITNRALILAALADGETVLRGALWSEDTQIMVECLQELGFMVNVEPDPAEPCNRTITVYGNGGAVPPGSTESQPMELFVGNAGTAARFLAAFVCLGKGVYRLSGVARMHERPQAALFQALRELGYRVESEKGDDKLPVKIFGSRSRGDETQTKKTGIDQSLLTSSPTKKCRVSIEESSQFASALKLCEKVGNWQVEIVGENAEESPYVAMTSKLMEAFPKNGGTFQIEPDASSGSYFWGAGWLYPTQTNLLDKIKHPILSRGEFARIISAYENKEPLGEEKVLSVVVRNWPISRWQIDQDFPGILYEFPDSFEFKISREIHLADSIMTAIALSPTLPSKSEFNDLGCLRLQETERVVALRTELTKCGAKVVEEDDTLTVWPSPLHGAEIETYHDHRMAMCFTILGLKVPGIKIKNPACVKKTFPNFFQKLAAPPPHGLGAEIWEIKNGQRTRKLSGEDLFAD